MRRFVVYTNNTYEEEKALVEVSGNMKELIIMGDYYHDKIDDRIKGFFEGLDYLNVEYYIEEKNLNPTDSLFDTLGFNID